MKSSMIKVIGLILFIVTNTVISININIYTLLEGTTTTIFNLVASIVFLVLWFLLSLYKGIKKEKMFRTFLIVYWGIDIFFTVLMGILFLAGFNPIFLLPFYIWYFSPLYGFHYILDFNIAQLILVTAPLGILFSSLGCFSGLLISKSKILFKKQG